MLATSSGPPHYPPWLLTPSPPSSQSSYTSPSRVLSSSPSAPASLHLCRATSVVDGGHCVLAAAAAKSLARACHRLLQRRTVGSQTWWRPPLPFFLFPLEHIPFVPGHRAHRRCWGSLEGGREEGGRLTASATVTGAGVPSGGYCRGSPPRPSVPWPCARWTAAAANCGDLRRRPARWPAAAARGGGRGGVAFWGGGEFGDAVVDGSGEAGGPRARRHTHWPTLRPRSLPNPPSPSLPRLADRHDWRGHHRVVAAVDVAPPPIPPGSGAAVPPVDPPAVSVGHLTPPVAVGYVVSRVIPVDGPVEGGGAPAAPGVPIVPAAARGAPWPCWWRQPCWWCRWRRRTGQAIKARAGLPPATAATAAATAGWCSQRRCERRQLRRWPERTRPQQPQRRR